MGEQLLTSFESIVAKAEIAHFKHRFDCIVKQNRQTFFKVAYSRLNVRLEYKAKSSMKEIVSLLLF